MTVDDGGGSPRAVGAPPAAQVLAARATVGGGLLTNRDILAGLLFVGVGVLGLWLSRDYPIGTALRMGTGYVPRLLCWIMVLLGAIVMAMGFRSGDQLIGDAPLRLRPFILIPAALVAFALTIESLGIVIAGFLLIGIGGLASSASRPLEVLAAAAVLVFFVWACFVWALGLLIPVWPGG